MTDHDKERIEKLGKCLDSMPKEEFDKMINEVDQLGIEGPTVEEYFNPTQIAFNQGKIEGFNEGIEAALNIIKNRNLIDFKVPIDFKYEVFDEIEKLKKKQ